MPSGGSALSGFRSRAKAETAFVSAVAGITLSPGGGGIGAACGGIVRPAGFREVHASVATSSARGARQRGLRRTPR